MRYWKMLILSGLFAAAVLAALVLVVSRNRPPAPPAPIVGVGIVGGASETPETSATTTVYVNADYGFSVDYPADVTPTEDPEEMAISGYIPVCDPQDAIVCFPYGEQAYAGTNFESAAFAVYDRTDLQDAVSCAKPQPLESPDGTRQIDGVTFRRYTFGEGAMSHRLSGDSYRAFRDGTCLELATGIAETTFEVWEPGSIERFTDADRAAAQDVLDAMLRSFRFTR